MVLSLKLPLSGEQALSFGKGGKTESRGRGKKGRGESPRGLV